MPRFPIVLAALLVFLASSLGAQTLTPPRHGETIEVTATKIAEDVMGVPAAVTVIDGDELRARNATDLASALGFTAGLSVAQGGDGGPAGSVPEMWGLREFDAFLLVVDGVPWGGAFNPDLPALDLTGVDRIEVLRGSAPVMYGATSFVGVIHVIHREPGAPGVAHVSGGTFGSASISAAVPIAQNADNRQSIVANAERSRFRDQHTGFERLHLLYRAARTVVGGTLRFDADALSLRQDPASPHPRVGTVLSPLVPLDANYNPRDAKLDENRFHVAGGFDTKLGATPWTTTLALTHSTFGIVRGFLVDLTNGSDNATGFRQDRGITDIYFDSHLVRTFSPALRVVAGVDHLFGLAHFDSTNFDYTVPLAGGLGQSSSDVEREPAIIARDRRNFSGLYATAEWAASKRLRIDAGARLNHTTEQRRADEDGDSRRVTRGSGSLGADWTLMRRGRDSLALFADYRNTFKPAAIDFGPEAEADILAPETAKSYEAGFKGKLRDGRLTWQTSVFQMDFSNLVVSTIRNGLPAVENAGHERFQGLELESDWQFAPAMRWELGYSYHDARFRDYLQDFDGTVEQLAGKRLEMSPLHLFGTGLVWAPATAWNANVMVNYVGDRYLTKRNTAIAKAYTTWSAGVGYRIARGELRLDGRNLSNVRPPVSESELGDAQYYRMPARRVDLSYRVTF